MHRFIDSGQAERTRRSRRLRSNCGLRRVDIWLSSDTLDQVDRLLGERDAISRSEVIEDLLQKPIP